MPAEDHSKLTALLTKLTDSESPGYESTEAGLDFLIFWPLLIQQSARCFANVCADASFVMCSFKTLVGTLILSACMPKAQIKFRIVTKRTWWMLNSPQGDQRGVRLQCWNLCGLVFSYFCGGSTIVVSQRASEGSVEQMLIRQLSNCIIIFVCHLNWEHRVFNHLLPFRRRVGRFPRL